jgi:acyl-coenzyme A synthetase/AMP-(fatty) acid ligase
MRLITAFCETARRFPDKVALITEKSQLSFSEILQVANACEAALLARGLRGGMRIVLTSERPEFAIAFALLLSRHSLTVIFASARLVHEAGIAYDLAVGTETSPLLPAESQVVVEPGWFGAAPQASLDGFEQAGGDGGAFVIATSGSTGLPKFVVTGEAAQMRNFMGIDYWRADPAAPDMRLLITVSMQMLWAIAANFRVLLAGGSVVALTEHRNRPLQYIDLARVSHLETTPVVIRQMLEVANAAQYLTALRSIVVGGAFASTELMARIAEKTAATIDVAYGTSEFGGLCLARFDPASPHGEGYLGEIFRSDIEIAFFDEALRRLPGALEGVVGFRSLRGDAPGTYLKSGADAAQKGFPGGYFFPGDVMRRVGNHLYLIGRIKNIINVGGNKIALEAVQVALEAALNVDALACLARTDAMGLEELLVVHTGPERIAPLAAQAVLDQHFPGLHLGRILHRQALPVTAGGKVDLNALRSELL